MGAVAFVGIWVLIAVLVGYAGNGRKIGYWGVFWLSVLLTPLIGLIGALLSQPVKIPPVINYNADNDAKLDLLRGLLKDGAISQDEYDKRKAALPRY